MEPSFAAVPPPQASADGKASAGAAAVEGQLSLPRPDKERAAAFETYKQCPSLLCETECFALPKELRADAAGRRALENPRGQLVVLFDDTVAVVAAGEDGIAVCALRSQGECTMVDCESPVISLCVASKRGVDCRAVEGNDALIVATTERGTVAVVEVTKAARSGHLSARLVCAASLFSAEVSKMDSQFVDVWILAAHAQASTGAFPLQALVWRRLGKDEVEISCVQVSLASAPDPAGVCSQLITLKGTKPPLGACLSSVGQGGLIVGEGAQLCGSDENPADDGGGGKVTVFWLGTGESSPRTACWTLPRGDLLAAWAEVDDSAGAGACGLAVLSADGHDAVAWRLSLPASSSASTVPMPVSVSCERIPALASCAAARAQLRLILASPSRAVLALVEAEGQHAVNVFRNPDGSPRAPTAVVHLDGLQELAGSDHLEVLGVVLSEKAITVLMKHGLAFCEIDQAAELASQSPRTMLTSREMPMGIDPQALLRMLDMRGDD